ncbi:Non-specific serine/threonine protein kinase [Handroanthus impetiginosus]|uniref:Non-specific serine/threonine protein kinase n=1 Tax=Handroanthus impetiginosus TaxID=429701 RepID=A0A2G9I3J3_9LAMI|nr:Non-specific serine/threonine protein kinase [Handroanthus impetiginosus]
MCIEEAYLIDFKDKDLIVIDILVFICEQIKCNHYYNDFGNDETSPFIGSLRRLQYLNLKDSSFCEVVPHQLGNLTNLRTIDLGLNSLNLFSYLFSLFVLNLSWFDFRHATFLEDIFKLPFLAELHLSECCILKHFFVNSTFDDCFHSRSILYSELTSSSLHWVLNMSTILYSIDLSSNYLSVMPDAFGNLLYLSISIPQIIGYQSFANINSSWNNLPEPLSEVFCKLSMGANESIRIMKLAENQFNGTCPNK